MRLWCVPTSRWSSSGNRSPCEKHAAEKTNANSIFKKESRNGKTIRCGSALPRTPFLPRKNFAGLFGERKPDDDKKEDAGILAYVKDDDAVSADFHLGSLQRS